MLSSVATAPILFSAIDDLQAADEETNYLSDADYLKTTDYGSIPDFSTNFSK